MKSFLSEISETLAINFDNMYYGEKNGIYIVLVKVNMEVVSYVKLWASVKGEKNVTWCFYSSFLTDFQTCI